MSETTVIHVRDFQPGDVYIGRTARHRPRSIWRNPYRVGKHGTREECIQQYEEHIREALIQHQYLADALPNLRGKRLACWCHPLPCHGDVLVKILKEREVGA